MKATETQIKNQLIKGGVNIKDASKLSKKHISYLNRVYPDATIKQKANIAFTLG